MGLAAGDYVTLRRPNRPGLSRRARGTIIRVMGDWADVALPSGGFFEAPLNDLTRLVRAEGA